MLSVSVVVFKENILFVLKLIEKHFKVIWLSGHVTLADGTIESLFQEVFDLG